MPTLARPRDVGSGDGRRRAVRDHAVRHRGDARPARREGLPDRRPGDRRHRSPRRTSGWAGSSRSRSRFRRQALAAAIGHLAAGPQAAGRRCCRTTRPSSCRKGRSSSLDPSAPIPMPMVGHVTSSYRSAALGRTFALAMVKAGRSRIGERVFAPLPDRTIVGRDPRLGAIRPGEPAPRRGAGSVIRRSPLDGVPMVEGLRELRFVPQFGCVLAPAQADAVAAGHRP